MTGPDPVRLDANRLRVGFSGRPFPTRVVVRSAVGSTQEIARNLAAAGAESGLLIVAESQTAGRGRLGRSWLSAKALGLYFSILLRPPCAPRELVWWTLGAGVALCDTCRRHGAPVELKWPNDLVAQGAKLGGVLADTRSVGESVEYLILGIGLNLFHRQEDFPPAFEIPATSLAQISRGAAVDPSQILIDAVAELGRTFEELERGDPAEIGQEWEARAPHCRGRRVRLRSAESADWHEGLTDGLDEEARLRIQLDTGRMIAARWVDTVRPVVTAEV